MTAPPDYSPDRPRTLRLADDPTTLPVTSQQVVAYGVNEPYGKPSDAITRGELRQTFGGVGTVFFAGIIESEEYIPELSGDQAIRTYDRMWRSDGQVAAVINVWVLPLIQATYTVQAASDDAEDIAVAQETSDNLMHGMVGTTWHTFLRQLYTFRAIYGHAVFEKCWSVDDAGAIRLKKLAPRLAKTLYRWYPNEDDELDRIMQRVWINNPNGVTGAYQFPTIPAAKLLVSTRQRIGNNFLGLSLLRPAYKHWYYKDQLYTLDGIAAAKNAMGVPSYTEPEQPDRTRQASDRTAALQALAAYQANERAAFVNPAGWKLEFLGVSGQVRNILPSIEHHDLLIARSILAQFINVDSGGTLIAARDSSSFFLQALFGEAQEVSDDVNPMIREMEEYNHAGRDRFSTLQMRDLDQRDVESYLRGLAALFTSKGLTNTPETENAIRDQMDLPLLPEARGAGTGGVDPAGQGEDATDAGDEAAVEPAELSRRVHALAAGAFRRRRAEGIVTVPRANGEVLELRRQGGRWESYTRQPSVWGGVTMLKGGRLGRWRLGDGGKSGTHCPQCVELAQGGWRPIDDFEDQRPGDGDTYCGDACTCSFEEKTPEFARPRFAAEGQRARGTRE